MRCPDCNKFVSFDEGEPELQSIDINGNSVTCEVRIVMNCAECGQELKEAMLDMDADVDTGIGGDDVEHNGNGHELSVEEQGIESTSRSGYFKKGVFVPAGGRYAKTYYGASVEFRVTCSCDESWEYVGTMEDDVQASAMDELV